MTISFNPAAPRASTTASAGQNQASTAAPAQRRPCGFQHQDGMDDPRTTTTRAEVASNAVGARALVGDGKNFIENIVEGQYQMLLGRSADAEGKAYWSKQVKEKLAAGESPESVSKFLDDSIKNSPEYKSGSTDGLVDQTYREELGRNAEPAGKAYWEGYVAEQKAKGVSTGDIREDLRQKLAHSEEGTPKHIAAAKSLNVAQFPDTTTAFSLYQRAGGDSMQLQRELRSGIREARHADRNGDGVVSERERQSLKSDVARWLTQSRLAGF